jgi:hypothetical protein
MATRSRVLIFAVLACTFTAVAVGYVLRARSTAASMPAGASLAPVAESMSALGGRPGLLFTSAAFDRTNGHLALEPLSPEDGGRRIAGLRCDRVHFAAGAGICLSSDRGAITTYAARIFGPDFTVRHSFPLDGSPSRARMSPDGRRAVMTVFVSGDSYDAVGVSTRTTLLDVATGSKIAELEEFAVTRNGAPFKAVDFNFWGVTFARDGNRFYATLRSGGKNYLVEGDIDARTARVLREGVECPSLSPDNTRLVFKKRSGAALWQLRLLDLATLEDTALAETRNVDDQAEWLDDNAIAYMLPGDASGGSSQGDIWTVAVASPAPPRILVRQAYSPVSIR